jgi:hypothetical protein
MANSARNLLIVIGSIIGGGVVLCGGCLTLFISSIPKPTAERRQESRDFFEDLGYQQQAEREAKTLITSFLKAPKTASFDFQSKTVRGEIATVIFVDGTVSSQNSFGALLTSPMAVVYWREHDNAANQLAYAQLDGEALPVGDLQLLRWCRQLADRANSKK